MIYLVSLYLLLYFFLAWRRLDWAVLIIIATLPSYLIRIKFLGAPFTLLEAMILTAFFVWLVKNYQKIINNLKLKFKNRKSKIANRKLFEYPFKWEIILFLIISFIAAGIVGFSDSALGIWKAYSFEPILLFIVVINVFKAKDIGKIVWAFLISALAVSFVAIYQKVTGMFIFNEFWAAPETRRVTSFFGYPNAVGLYLGPLVLIFIGWLMDKFQIPNSKLQINSKFQIPNYKFLIILITIILSILSIYFVKSVGALVGISAGIIVFGLLAGRKARLATVAIILLAVIMIGVYQPFRLTAYKYLTLNNFSGQIRKLQWRETWKMLKDGRIISGAGLANYQKAIALYHQEGFFYNKDNDPNFHRQTVFNAEYRAKVWQPLEIYLYPHNIFLNFWSELGLAGMSLFIWIFIKFYYLGFKILIGNWKLLASLKLSPRFAGEAGRRSGEIGNFERNNYNLFIIGLLSSMTVIIIHGLVDVPYFKNDLAVAFWIIIAMLGITDLEVNKTQQRKIEYVNK